MKNDFLKSLKHIFKKTYKTAKILSFALIAFVVCVGVFFGCGEQKEDNLTVVCTAFSQYDWINEIVGDAENENGRPTIKTVLLGGNGADMHSYSPTVEDIALISSCDAFVYIGGESEKWVNAALKNANNKNLKSISLFQILSGDLLCEEHEHASGESGDDSHSDDEEYDEHVWLSIKNAVKAVGALCEKLCELDETNSDLYQKNADEYIKKLLLLDGEYADCVNSAKHDVLVFGDRFPFLYLLHDYGLKHYAAFSGCSAESEASFETIVYLSSKINELSLPAIIKIDGSTHKIAETVKNNTELKNQLILTLNSMQSITKSQIESGVSYYDIAKENLAILKIALGAR